MDKELHIDLDAVNGSVSKLNDYLIELDKIYEKVKAITGGLDSAWSGKNTADIYSQIGAFGNSISTIRGSIASINNAVSKYSTNVQDVDTNTAKLENGNN